jgi:hypothetical protein
MHTGPLIHYVWHSHHFNESHAAPVTISDGMGAVARPPAHVPKQASVGVCRSCADLHTQEQLCLLLL